MPGCEILKMVIIQNIVNLFVKAIFGFVVSIFSQSLKKNFLNSKNFMSCLRIYKLNLYGDMGGKGNV
jgi:hypothetical protein